MNLLISGPLCAAQLLWRPGHGGLVLTVVCKATFALRPGLSPLAPTQRPIVAADVYSESGSLEAPSDLVPFKKQPEVVLTGHAFAPEGKRATSFVARLVVGEIDKAVLVTGDRAFGPDGQLSEPAPFVRMPLVWQRAAGGPGTSNPVGRPLGPSALPDAHGHLAAPNLLPVGRPLVSRGDVVPIVGFGPIAQHWPSRARCLHRHAAGWDPGRWSERPLPADLDLAYFNVAPPDQWRSTPFGEEAIVLENLHPLFSTLSTHLAPVAPLVTVEREAGSETPPLRCDTLLIDTDRGLATLVWRAHVVLDRPDQPGRITVAEAGAPAAPARPSAPPAFERTQAAELHEQASIALPFSKDRGGSTASAEDRSASALPPGDTEKTATGSILSGETLAVDALFGSTMAFGFAPAAPATPFPMRQGEDATAREPASAPRAGLPFAPSAAASPAPDSPPPLPPSPPPLQIPLSDSPASLPWPASPPAPPPEPPSPAAAPAAPPMLGPIPLPEAPPAPTPEETPEAASPGVLGIERCAAVTASIARRRSETASILEANGLHPMAWADLERHWKTAVAEEAARGETELLAAFDEAYVAQLERERGPATVEEYARLVVATERGKLPETLAEMSLPRGAMIRIERVWQRRAAGDEEVEESLRRAVKAAREAR